MKNQQGFTLIELIVVIVILGILAATAMPKFLDIQGDARRAAMTGAAGAISSAANLAHASQMVAGLGAGSAVALGGASITMVNGYPDTGVGGILFAANITDAAGVSTEWTVAGGNTVRMRNGPVATCQVVYTAATAVAGPIVTPDTTGC